jgi:hypothetical protein
MRKVATIAKVSQGHWPESNPYMRSVVMSTD